MSADTSLEPCKTCGKLRHNFTDIKCRHCGAIDFASLLFFGVFGGISLAIILWAISSGIAPIFKGLVVIIFISPVLLAPFMIISPLTYSSINRLEKRKNVHGLVKLLKKIEQNGTVDAIEMSARVRESSAEALGRIGGTQAIDPLLAASDDPAHFVREAVSKALAQVGSIAVDPLLIALKNQNISAIRALGKIGDTRAIDPLISSLKSSNRAVRQAALEALIQMGGPQASEAIQAFRQKEEVEAQGQKIQEAQQKQRLAQQQKAEEKQQKEWESMIFAGGNLALRGVRDFLANAKKNPLKSERLESYAAFLTNYKSHLVHQSIQDVQIRRVMTTLQGLEEALISDMVKGSHYADIAVESALEMCNGLLEYTDAVKTSVQQVELIAQNSRNLRNDKEISEEVKVQHFLAALQNADVLIRRDAIENLRILGNPAAIDPLCDILMHEEDEIAIVRIAHALTQLNAVTALPNLFMASQKPRGSAAKMALDKAYHILLDAS